MDVSSLVQSMWLTSTDVKNSPTKIVTILNTGEEEEVLTKAGEKYKAIKLLVSLDKVEKQWRLNKYSLRKMVERFGPETSGWLGKSISVTTMLMQGGKEGVAPA